MRSGELAEQAGVGVETLRYYERRGLLTARGRSAAGYREYDEGSLQRVRFIRRAQALGFTLEEIAELLDLACDGRSTCGEVRRRAEAKADELDERIASMGTLRDALRDLAAECHAAPGGPACPFLDRLMRREDDLDR
jgi:DNA-binding transcriptional MerR regulator